LKDLAYKSNGQRTRLKNNNAEMSRLIQEIQDFGKVVLSGDKVRLDDWLVGGKRKRRADIALTQGSDGLSQSQSSNATSEAPSKSHDDEYTESPKGEFSDDVTESGEDDEDSKRSLDTEGEVEDEESTDSSYERRKTKKERKRAKKEKKRNQKKEKKENRKDKDRRTSSSSKG